MNLTATDCPELRLKDQLLKESGEQRQRSLERHLASWVAHALGCHPSLVGITQPLSTMGLDSLMMTELKARARRELGIKLPMADIMGGANIATVATRLLERLPPRPTGPPMNLSDLSEEEVVSMLRTLLARSHP